MPKFLSEVIPGVNGTQPNDAQADMDISPFTESIVIATICGRALGVKQTFAVADTDRDIQEYCQRHLLLNTLLTVHIKILWMQISSSFEHPDPMLVFATLIAYMTTFMLSESVESLPVTDEWQEILIESKQRSLEAARGLGIITTVLTQLNHFQVSSPLSPTMTSPLQEIKNPEFLGTTRTDTPSHADPTLSECEVLLGSCWLE
jgi:hypothetical protein